MGTNFYNRILIAPGKCRLFCNDSGDAVVEATFLFPVMTMIFAALVLISIYLPAQAVLQQSSQYAATAISTEISDTWLSYDLLNTSYYWEPGKDSLTNVYAVLFEHNAPWVEVKGDFITRVMEGRSTSSKAGELDVLCHLNNKIVYSEVVIAASRVYPIPVNLSLIGFPEKITVSATSVAVVQNGDEFVRNMDLATDFARFLVKKFELEDVGKSISDFGSEVKDLLGW